MRHHASTGAHEKPSAASSMHTEDNWQVHASRRKEGTPNHAVPHVTATTESLPSHGVTWGRAECSVHRDRGSDPGLTRNGSWTALTALRGGIVPRAPTHTKVVREDERNRMDHGRCSLAPYSSDTSHSMLACMHTKLCMHTSSYPTWSVWMKHASLLPSPPSRYFPPYFAHLDVFYVKEKYSKR